MAVCASDRTASATSIHYGLSMAEAGSREVPPAFTVHDDEQSLRTSTSCPTKLFIGGISRHTTTKQLRDHFSQYAEVLDCIAMRGGDGRPRGFGYVTLDSPAAAQRCLCEPQLIDNRIVDMKLAVPESAASSKIGFAKQASLSENAIPRYGYNTWPGADSFDGHSWWPTCQQQILTGQYEQGLDVLQILSQTRDSPSLSAGAPEFVPLSGQTSPEAKISQSTPSPVKKKATPPSVSENVGQKRRALGEITNVVAVDDLLKPFKSPTNKNRFVGHGHLNAPSSENAESPTPNLASIAVDTHHMGVRIDEDVLDEVRRSDENMNKYDLLISPPTSSDEEDDNRADNLCDDGSEASEQFCSQNDFLAEEEASPLNFENLPSLGSALHSSGECKRCNFFAKGRCQNGKACSFCHFSHEVRKLTRQEKRERRNSKLQTKAEESETIAQEQESPSRPCALSCDNTLLGASVPESLLGTAFTYAQNNEATSDETYAYSIFPGLPPIRAMKLPAPLALPSMDVSSQKSHALPPGLVAPRSSFSANDQTTSDLLNIGTTKAIPSTLLSTTPSASLSTARTAATAFLSTTPSPTLSAAEAQAKTVGVSTTGTQTDENYGCPNCEKRFPEGSNAPEKMHRKSSNMNTSRWTREELLKLRGNRKDVQASGDALFHVKSIVALGGSIHN